MKITTKCPQCKKTVEPNITHTPTCMRIGCPDCNIIILEITNENNTQTKSENSSKTINQSGKENKGSKVSVSGVGEKKISN